MKHLTHGIAVLGLVQDGGVKLGEGGEGMPHQLDAWGLRPCSTGQEQADARVCIGTGGLELGGKSPPRAAQSLGVLPTVFFSCPGGVLVGTQDRRIDEPLVRELTAVVLSLVPALLPEATGFPTAKAVIDCIPVANVGG